MATTKARTNKVNIRMHFFMSQFFIPIGYNIICGGNKNIFHTSNLFETLLSVMNYCINGGKICIIGKLNNTYNLFCDFL